MQLYEQFDHGETKSCAVESPGQATVDLTERSEQMLHAIGRNADAAVGDAQFEEVREVTLGQREPSAGPCAGELADRGPGDVAGTEGDLAALTAFDSRL